MTLYTTGMHRKKKSLSQELAEELREHILEGKYRAGEQLPAEVDYARELGVSRATLRDTLSILERQGLVERKHGVGSFVSSQDHQIITSFEKLESMKDLIRRSGYDAELRVLDYQACFLDQYAASILKVPEGTPGICIRTLYSANAIPFVYTMEYTLSSFLSDPLIARRDGCEDLADFISRNTGNPPVATLTKLKGILPTEELMDILMIDANSPIIRQRFTLFDRKKEPLGCGYDFFNSSWFEFSIYTDTIRL